MLLSTEGMHTVGGIFVGEEVEMTIEVSHVVILKDIASYAEVEKGRGRSERREMHRQDVAKEWLAY